VFCLDLYLIDLTPHWGQRELVQRYDAQRSSDAEPLLACQLNWKGENFYTGNRVHVFSNTDNAELLNWVGDNRGRRAFLLLVITSDHDVRFAPLHSYELAACSRRRRPHPRRSCCAC
jgi:hypothetical protein